MRIGRNPTFCCWSPTRACVGGNAGVRSLWDNATSSVMGGSLIVRKGCDCQHQGGQGLGANGMVNKYELPINVVTAKELKMLISSDQNGK